MKQYDVVVVGAGPSGGMALYRLAKCGLKVALLERYILPRKKPCAGGLVKRAIDAMPFSIEDIYERHCNTVDVQFDKGKIIRVNASNPIIITIKRDEFDLRIVSEAQRQGAHIYEGHWVEDIRVFRDHVKIQTDKGTFSCKFLIGADGALSLTRRKAGINENRIFFPALVSHIEVRDRLKRPYEDRAVFDFYSVPYGYGWIFPKKDHLSVGVGVFKRRALGLKDRLEHFIGRRGLLDGRCRWMKGALIPVLSTRPEIIKRRILFIGDAAGLVDPVVGEGISLALRSGLIAADAIVKGEMDEDVVGYIYRRDFQQKILSQLKGGLAVSKIIYKSHMFLRLLMNLWGKELIGRLLGIFNGRSNYIEEFFNLRAFTSLLFKVK